MNIKKLLINIGIILAVIIIAGLVLIINNIVVYIIAVTLIIFGVVLWYLRRMINKRKAQAQALKDNIPKEVLEIFNQAEQQIKNNPEKNPYTILWNLTNKCKGGYNKDGRRKDDNGRGTPTLQELGISEGESNRFQPMGNNQDTKVRGRIKRID